MIYTDIEKQVYVSPLDTKHDPVEVCNRLTVHSQGKWNDWLSIWYGEQSSEVERAAVALQLAAAARPSFGFKPITQEGGVGDGSVLEVVQNFMEYVAKKA